MERAKAVQNAISGHRATTNDPDATTEHSLSVSQIYYNQSRLPLPRRATPHTLLALFRWPKIYHEIQGSFPKIPFLHTIPLSSHCCSLFVGRIVFGSFSRRVESSKKKKRKVQHAHSSLMCDFFVIGTASHKPATDTSHRLNYASKCQERREKPCRLTGNEGKNDTFFP